jgi:pantothenate kinase
MKVEITTANIINKVIKVDNVNTIMEALNYYIEKVLIPQKMFVLSDTAWTEIRQAIVDNEVSEASVVELINCSCKNALYKITKVTSQIF